jgi:ribonucleoside-diphosphate reductase alpha chain
MPPSRIPTAGLPDELASEARRVWDEAFALGRDHGYRNAQTTLLAPTGTIAFMMDCDTTGIEPDIALVKYKKLVGEGFLKLVNGTVPAALSRLGYDVRPGRPDRQHIDEHETIEGAPDLRPEDLPVFDCAFKPVNGDRSIHYMGHIRMMAAVQPFLSGAISKTVNMPTAATAEESSRSTRKAGASVSRRSRSIATALSARNRCPRARRRIRVRSRCHGSGRAPCRAGHRGSPGAGPGCGR